MLSPFGSSGALPAFGGEGSMAFYMKSLPISDNSASFRFHCQKFSTADNVIFNGS